MDNCSPRETAAYLTWLHWSQAGPTWSFGLPVCDATQPEYDGSLVLLHNLQKVRGMVGKFA